MFVSTSMDSESEDATQITSALADPRIYSFMKMLTLDMYMFAVTIFLIISPSFSSSVVTMSTSRLTGVCMKTIRTKNHFLKITMAHFLKTLIARKKSNAILTVRVKEDERPGTENQKCPLLDLSYHFFIGPVLWRSMEELDSASISATCELGILIAPMERETATKHVCEDRVYRPLLDEWCYVPRYPKITCW